MLRRVAGRPTILDPLTVGRCLRAAVDPCLCATGLDGTGAVAVTVDGRGTADRVDIAARWLPEIGATALGAAVMSAYRAASADVAAATIRRYLDILDHAAVPVPTDVPAFDMPDRLHRARVRLAEVMQRAELTGPAGLLRVSFDRGLLTGMTAIDRPRVSRARPALLAAEALWLLRSATNPT